MKIDYASKGSDTMITKDMTLADVVKAHPNTIGFLNGCILITAAADMILLPWLKQKNSSTRSSSSIIHIMVKCSRASIISMPA